MTPMTTTNATPTARRDRQRAWPTPLSSERSSDRRPLSVRTAIYNKLSFDARCSLAAIERCNAEDRRSWPVGFAYAAKLARLPVEVFVHALSELREAKVIDFLAVFDDTHTAAIVAAWPDRAAITCEITDRVRRTDRRPLKGGAA